MLNFYLYKYSLSKLSKIYKASKNFLNLWTIG